MNSEENPFETPSRLVAPQKNTLYLIYILYGVAYLIGLSAVVGVIIAYIKQDDANEPHEQDHFRWQINTFWITLLLIIIGAITLIIFIGWIILFLAAVWNIYRIAKGVIRLNENKSPYV